MADETRKLTGAAAAAAAKKAAKEADAQSVDPAGTGADSETTGGGSNTLGTGGAAEKATKPVKAAKPAAKSKTTGSKAAKAKAVKTTETGIAKAGEESYDEIAARYKKLYPGCKKFHITEDRQVFLEDSEGAARMHQRSLGGGEVHTIETE